VQKPLQERIRSIMYLLCHSRNPEEKRSYYGNESSSDIYQPGDLHSFIKTSLKEKGAADAYGWDKAMSYKKEGLSDGDDTLGGKGETYVNLTGTRVDDEVRRKGS